MTDLKTLLDEFGDENTQENAVEALVVSVQLALQRAMSANCVTRKELAERLGLSAARVSQILSADGANLTLKTIARVALALGEDFEFVSQKDAARIYREESKVAASSREVAEKGFLNNLNSRRSRDATKQIKWRGGANDNASPMFQRFPTRIVA